jgi:hypothetical protein
MTTVEIDFDKLLNEALKGVRRASVFMGFGVNAALDQTFKDYQLSSITRIQIVPNDVSEVTVNHFKEEFRIWIEAAGFRELTESFSSYLDSLHRICLVMQAAVRQSSLMLLDESDSHFKSQGFPNKINILSNWFSVGSASPDYLLSLNRARNCLVHRRGIVGKEDIREDAKLDVCWKTLSTYGESPDGEKYYLDDIPEDGVLFPHGACIKVQWTERRRTFPLGSKLILSTRDLAEICMFYQIEARETIRSAVKYGRQLGVQFPTA